MPYSIYTQTGYHGSVEDDGHGVLHGLSSEEERDAREVVHAVQTAPRSMRVEARRGAIVVVDEVHEDNFA
jgi:hypothetical protein